MTRPLLTRRDREAAKDVVGGIVVPLAILLVALGAAGGLLALFVTHN